MSRSIKIGLVLLVLLLAAGGYYYYKTTFAPKHFVTSFLEELEYKGARNVGPDFFLHESWVTSDVTWEDFLATKIDTAYHLSEEQYFSIWKSGYLRGAREGYFDVTLACPTPPKITTDETFRGAYGDIDFSTIELEYVDVQGNSLYAMGYATLKPNNILLQMRLGGKRKWSLFADNGQSGWRIRAFGPELKP
jgi:hypothetical protein